MKNYEVSRKLMIVLLLIIVNKADIAGLPKEGG